MSPLERGLSGAALVTVIILLRLLLGRYLPRRTFVLLWWAAALRFLLPFAPPSPLSAGVLLRALRPKPEAAGTGIPVRLLPPVSPAPTVGIDAAAAPAPLPVWQALWALGTVLLALWFLTAALRWRRRFADALPAREDCALRWAARHPRIALRRSDRITTPLSYGLLRPVILLPKGLEDAETLRCVLAHEEAHIRHLDNLAKPLFAAALCLHWWNPAAWALFLLAGRDLELSCDEAAVRRIGQPAAYARALLQMAEQRSHPLHSHFTQSPIEERISAIMKINLKKISLPALLCAALLVAGLTTAFATSAPEDTAEPAPPAPGEAQPLPQDTESLLLPVAGAQLSAPFSQRTVYTYPDGDEDAEPVEATLLHSGLDFSADRGVPICAVLSGTVADTGFTASLGNYVLLAHENGCETLYAHCQSVSVSSGDAVTQGDPIATVGSTGMATGPHLHFELRQDGQPIDPLPLLPELS